MITCEACGREFRTHRGLDCPLCGYDNGPGEAAGDGQTGQTYTYDAWNRLVAVEEWTWTDTNEDGVFQPEEKSNPVAVAAYEYDGLGRRIQKTVGETTDDYYYNQSCQVLKVRRGGDPDPLDQYVWDVRYVDAPVVRFHDGNTDDDLDGGSEEGDNTLYYTTDANWNVTALVDAATGDVVERYMYDAYGKATVLNGANGTDPDVNGTTVFEWDVDADGLSDVANDVLFAGYRFDSETGLYDVRNRQYHPTLGRWIERDPAGYIDTPNLYQYCRSDPATLNDSLGTCPALPLIIILEGAEGVEIIDGVIVLFDTVLLKYIMDMIPTQDGTGHDTSDPWEGGARRARTTLEECSHLGLDRHGRWVLGSDRT